MSRTISFRPHCLLIPGHKRTICAIFIRRTQFLCKGLIMVLLQTSPLIRNNELYLKKYFADYFLQYQGKPHDTENNCRCLAKCINRLDGAVYRCYAG